MLKLNVINMVNELSMDELLELNSFVLTRYRNLRSYKSTSISFEFQVGQKVSFRGRRNIMVHGTITKINRVRALVNDGRVTWTVPFASLQTA